MATSLGKKSLRSSLRVVLTTVFSKLRQLAEQKDESSEHHTSCGEVAELVVCLPGVHRAVPASVPSTTAHTCEPSIWEENQEPKVTRDFIIMSSKPAWATRDLIKTKRSVP